MAIKEQRWALIEIRRKTVGADKRPVTQQYEVCIVPFKEGPRCYVNALERVGYVGKVHGSGYSNRTGLRCINWSDAYVCSFADGKWRKRLIDRIKFIREMNPNAVVRPIRFKESDPLVYPVNSRGDFIIPKGKTK